MQKNNWLEQVLRQINFLLTKKIVLNFTSLFIVVSLSLPSSCYHKKTKTSQQKIESFESKARTYKKLSDLQRLSSPYPITRRSFYRGNLRSTYLRESKRYQKLADTLKEQIEIDANKTVRELD